MRHGSPLEDLPGPHPSSFPDPSSPTHQDFYLQGVISVQYRKATQTAGLSKHRKHRLGIARQTRLSTQKQNIVESISASPSTVSTTTALHINPRTTLVLGVSTQHLASFSVTASRVVHKQLVNHPRQTRASLSKPKGISLGKPQLTWDWHNCTVLPPPRAIPTSITTLRDNISKVTTTL